MSGRVCNCKKESSKEKITMCLHNSRSYMQDVGPSQNLGLILTFPFTRGKYQIEREEIKSKKKERKIIIEEMLGMNKQKGGHKTKCQQIWHKSSLKHMNTSLND